MYNLQIRKETHNYKVTGKVEERGEDEALLRGFRFFFVTDAKLVRFVVNDRVASLDPLFVL
jgi:hypothetical protein